MHEKDLGKGGVKSRWAKSGKSVTGEKNKSMLYMSGKGLGGENNMGVLGRIAVSEKGLKAVRELMEE